MGPLLRGNATASLLALLASVPGEELHTNELIRRTGVNPNSAQRTLTQLEGSGLVESRRLGNLRLWRMRRDHPLYASVRDLVVRTRGLPLRLAQILKRDGNIKLAFLFGSYVQAQDDASSDIDIFVVGRADWDVLGQAIRAASAEVGRELRPIVWSPRDLRSPTAAQSGFLTNILSDPVMWVVGDRSEFERYRQLARPVARRREARQSEPSAGRKSRQGRSRQRRASAAGS
jgi:predicted nucleotidyltransferase